MFMYIFSIVIIITSNVLYNICQKSIPLKANPFSALIVTYLFAAILSIIAFVFSKADKGFFQSFTDLNWTSFVLAFAIMGLEFGYLMAYRAGWNISLGSLTSNICLALLLIPIGILFYNDNFGYYKLIGAVFCIIGLIFISK
jgi:hypothetical protein